jgi:hypothetical protein
MAHSHHDAVGRRALHGKPAFLHLAQPQRIVERERMRDAGLIGFRRDDPDVVRERARDLGAHVEPRRMDAVVVGNEDAHVSLALAGP